jgi:hypothetical protein
MKSLKSVNNLFQNSLLGEKYNSKTDFEAQVTEAGKNFGVYYTKDFNPSTNQYYMRCHFYQLGGVSRKDGCKALVYARKEIIKQTKTLSTQITIKRIDQKHTHMLYSKEEMK